ncbi:MAG: hypothetical protein QM688_01330 [Sphingomonas bacterium]
MKARLNPEISTYSEPTGTKQDALSQDSGKRLMDVFRATPMELREADFDCLCVSGSI